MQTHRRQRSLLRQPADARLQAVANGCGAPATSVVVRTDVRTGRGEQLG